MDHERDSGLMSAPESELLHELVRLREENAQLRRQLFELKLQLIEARPAPDPQQVKAILLGPN